MNGFDIEHNSKVLRDAVMNKFKEGEDEFINILSSPGYSDIIEDYTVGPNLSSIEIVFKDGIDTEGQNVFQTLAYGGSFLLKKEGKEDEYLDVPPSQTLQKYIGTR